MSEEIKKSEEMNEQHYGENEIQVLEGLEAVRITPSTRLWQDTAIRSRLLLTTITA